MRCLKDIFGKILIDRPSAAMKSVSARSSSPLPLFQEKSARGESGAWFMRIVLWKHFEHRIKLQMKQSRQYALNGWDAQN